MENQLIVLLAGDIGATINLTMLNSQCHATISTFPASEPLWCMSSNIGEVVKEAKGIAIAQLKQKSREWDGEFHKVIIDYGRWIKRNQIGTIFPNVEIHEA